MGDKKASQIPKPGRFVTGGPASISPTERMIELPARPLNPRTQPNEIATANYRLNSRNMPEENGQNSIVSRNAAREQEVQSPDLFGSEQDSIESAEEKENGQISGASSDAAPERDVQSPDLFGSSSSNGESVNPLEKADSSSSTSTSGPISSPESEESVPELNRALRRTALDCPPTQSPESDPHRLTAVLTLDGNRSKGLGKPEFKLFTHEVTIGREGVTNSHHLALLDPNKTVSERHAKLYFYDDSWFICIDAETCSHGVGLKRGENIPVKIPTGTPKELFHGDCLYFPYCGLFKYTFTRITQASDPIPENPSRNRKTNLFFQRVHSPMTTSTRSMKDPRTDGPSVAPTINPGTHRGSKIPLLKKVCENPGNAAANSLVEKSLSSLATGPNFTSGEGNNIFNIGGTVYVGHDPATQAKKGAGERTLHAGPPNTEGNTQSCPPPKPADQAAPPPTRGGYTRTRPTRSARAGPSSNLRSRPAPPPTLAESEPDEDANEVPTCPICHKEYANQRNLVRHRRMPGKCQYPRDPK